MNNAAYPKGYVYHSLDNAVLDCRRVSIDLNTKDGWKDHVPLDN